MRAWPVARSIFDAPLGGSYVREANERTTGWISLQHTVIASRASPPLLEQSSSTIRFEESWTRVARQLTDDIRLPFYLVISFSPRLERSVSFEPRADRVSPRQPVNSALRCSRAQAARKNHNMATRSPNQCARPTGRFMQH